jgi:hypothetical protein
MKPWVIKGTLGLVVVIGAYVILDTLIVTDEERVREFATALNGPVSTQYVDHLLRWVDLEVHALEVQVRGESFLYRAGERSRLVEEAHRGLSIIMGSRVRTLSRRITIEGDDARVEVRLFSQGGVRDARFRLRRNGETWLVERVRVM